MKPNNIMCFERALQKIKKGKKPKRFNHKVLQTAKEHDFKPVEKDTNLFENNNAYWSKKYPYIILSKCILYRLELKCKYIYTCW